jgi:ATP-dependent DNA ligase
MQPMSKRLPFDDPAWIFELKHEGFRALALTEGNAARLLSRRGNDLLACFPEIGDELMKLGDMVIDGELVWLDADGRSSFTRLRRRFALRNARAIAAASRR